MRGWPWLLLIAGCAAAEAPAPDRSREIGACTAVVAEHVGAPASTLTATWEGTTPSGIGVVRVVDEAMGAGDRVHRCELDAAGDVRAVLHVRA
jgi:hypothetical protein